MRHVISMICSVIVLAGFGKLAWTDERPRNDSELNKAATHVVAGKVTGVYATEPGIDKGVVNYVIEIEVDAVRKGEGPKPKEVLYVRCWNRKEPSREAGVSNGQASIPQLDNHQLFYLVRGNDGAYDVLTPNGIGKVPSKK